MDKEIANKLRTILRKYSYEYYIENNPSVSDAEYDGLFRMLQSYEAEHPEDIPPDSPTQTVGSKPER